jgi:large conductance mechanosensitive channel
MREHLHGLSKEFESFILRGNIIALAVAFVVAAAFKDVIFTLVEALASPLVAAIFGEPDFAALTFTINDSVFRYGEFLNALVSFLLVGAAVFFVIVRPVNRLADRDPSTWKCPECRSAISIDASRCAFCATAVDFSLEDSSHGPTD